MDKKNIIIDTDPGIDDAIAILFALVSNKIELKAITTVAGNVDVEKCTKNALKILEMVGRTDVPVVEGACKPLVKRLRTAEYVHGIDGLGNTNLAESTYKPLDVNVVDFFVDTILKNREPITIVPVGPLTNIALSLIKEPKIADKINEIIFMGGTAGSYGNVTPLAEANMYCDPHAAKIILQSGISTTMVGLNVTQKPLVFKKHLKKIYQKKSPISEFIIKILNHYIAVHKKFFKIDGCAIHDALAVAVAINRNIVKTKKLYVDVELNEGLTQGATIVDYYGVLGKESNIDVCVDVDSELFLSMLLNNLQKYQEKY